MPSKCLALELGAVSSVFGQGFLWQLGSRVLLERLSRVRMNKVFFASVPNGTRGKFCLGQNKQLFGQTPDMNDSHSKGIYLFSYLFVYLFIVTLYYFKGQIT